MGLTIPTRTAPTVDRVLAVFTKAINDLDSVQQRNLNIVAEQESIIAAANVKADAATAEANRAEVIATKLNALLSAEG